MKAIGNATINKGQVMNYSLMEVFIKDNTSMESLRELVNILGRMVNRIKDNGLTD